MTDVGKIQQGMQKVVEESTRSVESSKPESPDAQDVEKFEQSLKSEPAQQNMETNQPEQVEATEGTSQGKSLGNTILNGLEKMKESRDKAIDEINKTLNKSGDEPLTLQETMKLQYQLIQVNLQQEVTTKVADKTNQGVQTLFKNQ